MGKIGFDNALYLQQQSEEILKRASRFDNKLYLEFGGKLAYDFHAARILPGFDPNVKLQLLQRLKDKIDVVIASIPVITNARKPCRFRHRIRCRPRSASSTISGNGIFP